MPRLRAVPTDPPAPRAAVPIREWALHPERKVTRGELLHVLSLYDRQREATVWYRRLWRWLRGGWDAMGPRTPTLPDTPTGPTP